MNIFNSKKMNKLIGSILYFLLISHSLNAQVFFDFIGEDNVKIFFDKNGDLCTSDKSFFYRIGKMDNNYFSFKGTVIDYNLDGDIIFTGNFYNGLLNGESKSFVNNFVAFEGNYKNGLRYGIWNFHKRDKLIKKMEYGTNYIKLCDYYDRKGNSKISNGKCKYTDYVRTYKNTNKIKISGKFENGLMTGKWNSGVFYEVYEKGEFISGYDRAFRSKYDGNSQIKISSFHPSESVEYYLNFCRPIDFNKSRVTLLLPQFNGTTELDSSFFRLLKKQITISLKEKINTYYLVEMVISKSNDIEGVKIFSPSKDGELNIIKSIINNLGEWRSAQTEIHGKNYKFIFYYPIIVDNGIATIPKYTGHNTHAMSYWLPN